MCKTKVQKESVSTVDYVFRNVNWRASVAKVLQEGKKSGWYNVKYILRVLSKKPAILHSYKNSHGTSIGEKSAHRK